MVGLQDSVPRLPVDSSDSRAEYMTPGSTGLMDTLNKANEIFANVKQTSDATLDSRLLVSAADLSYKKTTSMKLGDTSQSIDLDEFVSKCITFMRRGPGSARRGRADLKPAAEKERRRSNG